MEEKMGYDLGHFHWQGIIGDSYSEILVGNDLINT
ncbi:Putative protein [Zobellia galactanivorans]|uniref:Uncharacterized protein n=1 Tax=Zobellia galactanivorans (strain DSM 12802 / CCUG 47099 / CIP 106680 / NCIMB 13871 / Dsij) TaxID=63186 RepID=G0L875_ZOBGA|nr:Putative protein [Zobellia galactanivorans]